MTSSGGYVQTEAFNSLVNDLSSSITSAIEPFALVLLNLSDTFPPSCITHTLKIGQLCTVDQS